MKKQLAILLKRAAEKLAKVCVNTRCSYLSYQPKQPKDLKKIVK